MNNLKKQLIELSLIIKLRYYTEELSHGILSYFGRLQNYF